MDQHIEDVGFPSRLIKLFEIHLVVMRGGLDDLHPLAEQSAKARTALHARVPAGGLLVAAPVEAAEIIGDGKLGGGGQIGQR
jgi:hypothetical protein